MPKLNHPESDLTIEVAPEAVLMYLPQGWRVVKAAETPEPARPKRK